MATRNITLSLPEELVRKAKVLAAQQDTSVSALVTGLLRQVTDQGNDYDSAWATEERLMAEGIGLKIGEITWSRAETHER